MSNVLRGTLVNPDVIYGKSAYEIAVAHGFDGTEEEWLFYIKGKSAYELAVLNGYKGTEEEWLASQQLAVKAYEDIKVLLEEYVGEVDALVGGD